MIRRTVIPRLRRSVRAETEGKGQLVLVVDDLEDRQSIGESKEAVTAS